MTSLMCVTAHNMTEIDMTRKERKRQNKKGEGEERREREKDVLLCLGAMPVEE